ncbi:MAG TPA: hypothetical protein VGF03_19815 [Bryobacteraceae bacterium]|jgi:hypothetical protein
MALFTDGPPSSLEQLAGLDSQLPSVASTEGIDLRRKLELAHEEIGLDLDALLKRIRPADGSMWAVEKPRLENVVVTAALKLWFAYRTLELVYSDAYNSQLNDRYMGKRDQFQQMAVAYRERLLEAGAGMASMPLPRPATPVLAAAPGSLPDNIYYVTAAWVNRVNEEGASAMPAAITTSFTSFTAQIGPAPKNATGWNVYVGMDPDSMALQNSAPLEVGAAWVQPVWINATGREPGRGQAPSYVQALGRILQRG